MINVIAAMNRIDARNNSKQHAHADATMQHLVPTYRFVFEHANAAVEDALGVQMNGHI